MLVGRCSSELSNHKLQAKSKKSQAPTEADLSRRAVEGSAVSLHPKTEALGGPFFARFWPRVGYHVSPKLPMSVGAKPTCPRVP
jgi:hypothetical protein